MSARPLCAACLTLGCLQSTCHLFVKPVVGWGQLGAASLFHSPPCSAGMCQQSLACGSWYILGRLSRLHTCVAQVAQGLSRQWGCVYIAAGGAGVVLHSCCCSLCTARRGACDKGSHKIISCCLMHKDPQFWLLGV